MHLLSISLFLRRLPGSNFGNRRLPRDISPRSVPLLNLDLDELAAQARARKLAQSTVKSPPPAPLLPHVKGDPNHKD